MPGKVCGKDIEVHCGGNCIVWAADPDRGRQREDQPSAKRSGVGAGVLGKGRGTRGTVFCPIIVRERAREPIGDQIRAEP